MVKGLKAFIIPSVIGVLAFREDGELIGKALFPKDPGEIAKRLERVNLSEIIGEVKSLIGELKSEGYETFVFEDAELAQNVREELKVNSEVKAQSSIAGDLRENLGEYAVKVQFLESPSELPKLVHEVSMELSRISVRKAAERRDSLVVQAVEALDDLDKTLNLFAGRMREWYGLHFPELNRLINNHEIYAKLVYNLGKRENFSEENLSKYDFPRRKVSRVVKAAQTSMGAELYDGDIEQIQTLCAQYLNLYEARKKIERYLEDMMEEEAPNVSALTGPILGARLIALAGGLENLAKMPSSTIQVLGAKKSLFKHLKKGTPPPKHGIISQHPLINTAPKDKRGKLARIFAGKLAIAVRIDYYSDGGRRVDLMKDLNLRIASVRSE